MPIIDAETGETKFMDLDLADQPGLWQMGKKYVDEELAFSVYSFALEVVMTFFSPKPTEANKAETQ